MATVKTTITPTEFLFPWQGIDDLARDRSDIPRAELRFSAIESVIAASGVGDNQSIQVVCDLPVNFSYVLLELYLMIGGSGQTDDVTFTPALCSIVDNDSGARTYNINFDLARQQLQSSSGSYFATYCTSKYPNLVIIPQPTAGNAQLLVDLYNPVANDSAVIANFYARFARYDISQAHHWQVNTPSLVR